MSSNFQDERQGEAMTNDGIAISVVQGVLERSIGVFPAALYAYKQAASTLKR